MRQSFNYKCSFLSCFQLSSSVVLIEDSNLVLTLKFSGQMDVLYQDPCNRVSSAWILPKECEVPYLPSDASDVESVSPLSKTELLDFNTVIFYYNFNFGLVNYIHNFSTSQFRE